MMKSESPEHVAVAMVSYLTVPGSIGEMHSKPTLVRTLNSAGVFADMIICRSPLAVDQKERVGRLPSPWTEYPTPPASSRRPGYLHFLICVWLQ